MNPAHSTSPHRHGARERVEAMRRQQQAKDRRRRLLIFGGATTAVLAIAAIVTLTIVREQASRPSLEAVQSFTVEAAHVETPVSYPQGPPVGGEHSPVWLNCGIYDQPVPNENAVHSLEHGAVWVTYRPDLSPAQVAQLRDALPDTYAILSPYPDLTSPVVASAWGKQLALTGPDDPRLDAFIGAYRQGPQTPEPGALCTGGTDGNG
ncbi:MAG: DUF3105 domain-containing protein [Dermatophilaceae bacterium]